MSRPAARGRAGRGRGVRLRPLGEHSGTELNQASCGRPVSEHHRAEHERKRDARQWTGRRPFPATWRRELERNPDSVHPAGGCPVRQIPLLTSGLHYGGSKIMETGCFSFREKSRCGKECRSSDPGWRLDRRGSSRSRTPCRAHGAGVP